MMQLNDLEVNLDIDIYNAPCELLDIRFMSTTNRQNSLVRYHLDSQGNVSTRIERGYEDIKQHVLSKGGCRLVARLFKHHLSDTVVITYSNPPLLAQLFSEIPEMRTSLSHKFNGLYLGDSRNHDIYER